MTPATRWVYAGAAALQSKRGVTNIIVLFGGRSDERHVSVASAQNVVRSLDRPLAWFEAANGAVHDVALDDLLAHQRPFEADFVPARPAIFPTLEQALDTMPVEEPVVLLAFHGGAGEDGTVQAMLEQRRIAYTGSDSTASAAAFDKKRGKELIHGRVRTAESLVLQPGDPALDLVNGLLARHERLVLKPLAGGSSRGLYFLGRRDDVEAVVGQVSASRVPYLVEEFITGRELTVGVIDHEDALRALPVVEIEVDSNRAFDYAGKYLGHGTREVCPARIPEELADAAQEAALEAHRAIGCFGYSRTDVIASPDGIVFLELNTLPGLTAQSLVPQELASAGIDFRGFLLEQVRRGMERNAER